MSSQGPRTLPRLSLSASAFFFLFTKTPLLDLHSELNHPEGTCVLIVDVVVVVVDVEAPLVLRRKGPAPGKKKEAEGKKKEAEGEKK